MNNSLSDKRPLCLTALFGDRGRVEAPTDGIGFCLTHVGGWLRERPHVRPRVRRRRANFKRRARRRALCGRGRARRRDARPEVRA